jgi:hypothetical protein
MVQPTTTTPVEQRIIDLLRSRVEDTIERHGLTWAAERLHLSEPGVDAVLWERTWSVGTAVHLAGSLDVLTEADVDNLVLGHKP